MRPTPAETIEGVRRILRDVVEPALTSDYAVGRVREIRAVLAQVDWNDAAINLACDNSRLASVVEDLQSWAARAEPAFNIDPIVLRPTVGRSAQAETFDQLNQRHHELSRIVTAAIGPLSSWVSDHPSDRAAEKLQRRLLKHYSGAP